jgi:crotonobetainyl-CoA:carnitine CoA-transferase CaiB-like acyl-CoA transferase
MINGSGLLDGFVAAVLGESPTATLCGTYLAEHGATVYKVEQPRTGDPLRALGPAVEGVSLRWATLAAGLRSVTCDLSNPRGRDLLSRATPWIDVICDGRGDGDPEAEELGDDVPVVLSFGTRNAFGGLQAGVAEGFLGEARGGLMELTGDPARAPLALGTDVAVHLAAAYGAQAAVAGLLGARRTGRQFRMSVPVDGAVLRITEWAVPAVEIADIVRRREGNFPSAVAPIGVYQTADGDFVGVVGASDVNFRRLVAAMDRPELLDDVRYKSVQDRAANGPSLHETIAAWAGSRTTQDLLARCAENVVIASGVKSVRDLIADPQVTERGEVRSLPAPVIGAIPQPAPQPHIGARVPEPGAMPAPLLGSANAEFWVDRVGVSVAELSALEAVGAV